MTLSQGDRHGVAIVLDRKYGGRLQRLSDRVHVWAADTQANRAGYQPPADREPNLEKGVTFFKIGDGTPEQALLEILSVVHEHHGPYSHIPPLSLIAVVGAALTPEVRHAFEERGFNRFNPGPGGFEAFTHAAT